MNSAGGAEGVSESDWLRTDEPQQMLESLRHSGAASERKLRLFGCACVRRVWHLLTEERSRSAVEMAEHYADGRIGPGGLSRAAEQALAAPMGVVLGLAGRSAGLWRALPACDAATATTRKDALAAARNAADQAAVAEAGGLIESEALMRLLPPLRADQADLLRDLLGPLPFRSVELDPALRTPSVLNLAQRAYDDRQLPQGTLNPSLLGVLADALEDAGCNSDDILSHLREQGAVHVRGCWVVDLLREGSAP